MNYIATQYQKYLDNLNKEISQYQNEADLWKLTGDLKNTPANLALHLCGNLKHNIGAVIGKNGFVRERDIEFSTKGISKAEILKDIESTTSTVIPILDSLTDDDLIEPFPEASHGEDQTVYDALIRLALHLGYHVGQINYHRRILTF